MAFNNKYNLTLESELPDKYASHIGPFWQKYSHASEFIGVDGVIIRYVQVIKPEHQQAIIISPGRIESYLKYQELSYDLSELGFDIYIIDHRGQGLSGRMTTNSEQGHVLQFSDYVTDFAYWVDQELDLTRYSNTFLIAHSMGCAISALYLMDHNQRFDKAAFCSPMFDINLGPFSAKMALSITNAAIKSNTMMRRPAQYAPGQGGYHPIPFEENDLTQSPARYHYFRQIYQAHPEIRLGGVTHQWLNQAILSTNYIIENADKITTPLLVLQASDDNVVNPQGQNQFCANLLKAGRPCIDEEPIIIGHARHELLIERDKYRVPSINWILDFFLLD
ncbi:alpha/beta fold hydrolase [Motilimonas cestriensis]|uniref:alpha/beta fold hydrolase n=1 Tax=Motilimonas cestriensis TaxID=2742685 RepID=UPI003DA306C3